MPISTSNFVTICTLVRRALKANAIRNRVNTGVKSIKKMQSNQPMIGAANKDLLKERKRMAKVLTQAAKIKKAKSIALTKIFIDEYEKSLRFAIQKHGTDPKNKDVKKQFDALKTYLKSLNKDYGGEVVHLRQALKAQKGDLKIARALSEAWYKYAKAFLALAVATGTNPMASGNAPSLWGNMEVCNYIAKQMSDLAGYFAISVRILEEAEAEASDRFYFINEHIAHTQQKDYLTTL